MCEIRGINSTYFCADPKTLALVDIVSFLKRCAVFFMASPFVSLVISVASPLCP